jgi:uncharacterized membrane protein
MLECDIPREKEEGMSRNKSVATGLLVVGIVILLVSALADVVGIGGSPNVLGYRQMSGIAVGAVLAIVGAILYWWAGREA